MRRRTRAPLAPALAALALMASALGMLPDAAGAAPRYHLSLGDSYARGVQPGPDGRLTVTGQGYGPLVARSRRLRLVELGCPGATARSMVSGGGCRYGRGSQMRAAEAFLRARRGRVALVTVSIGGNDILRCGTPEGLDPLCAAARVPGISASVTRIARRLRRAAPRARIVGLTYPNPFLALYLRDARGRGQALSSAPVAELFSAALRGAYASRGARTADVAGAFSSSDLLRFETLPGVGSVPVAVARVCRLTWACAPPPRGPDVHPTAEGYRVIARAVSRAAR